jgi:arylsulfatase A
MNRPILLAPLLLFALLTAMNAANAATAPKPNIIVILADDIGAGELSSYGHPEHKTPVLDRLGAAGVKFETCFTSPVCHPTRFMLMTGQYGCHNGVYNFGGKRGGPERGDPNDKIATHRTFGQILKAAGYATAIAGKWQLSGVYPEVIRECGFDESCMWGYEGYYTKEEQEKVSAAGIGFASRYWHPSIIQNGDWLPTVESDYGPDIFTGFLCDFIQRKKNQPFFLYYPMCLTHTPWYSTPDSTLSPADKTKHSKTNLKANVEYMDKLVGRIVTQLDDLGLRDNTVIFFTGDNGTANRGKSQPTEVGARVPMIVNGPGIVKPRGASMELTDLSDVLPTIVELGRGALPQDRPIDGHSYAKFLRGESETTRDWIFAFQADRRILRTKRWLLEDNSPLHWGQLFDCGESRNGDDYIEVTDSQDPEALAAKAFFNQLIKKLPAPLIDHEGAPNEPLDN